MGKKEIKGAKKLYEMKNIISKTTKISKFKGTGPK